MFKSARIKLTAWYLLIIMFVSMLFSTAIYRVLASELDRVERMQSVRFRLFPNPYALDRDLVSETKYRLRLFLAGINILILGTSATAGYFLAGRTLKPIADMVEKQREFVSNASHELRTPLTSLKSEIEVSLRDKKLTLSEAKKLLSSNLEEVDNLQELSDRLIKLTKYQEIGDALSMEKVNAGEICNTAVKKISGLAKKKKISIAVETKNEIFEANKQSLIELLVIFLDNAIKYSPEAEKVVLSSRKTDGYILFSISDNGVGIAQNDLPNLFSRFFRANASRTKNETDGYGLGLSIAKQIIDRHNGSIKVKSKPKNGSVFTVRLPVKQRNT